MHLFRAGLLAGVATVAMMIVPAAHAETAPSVQEIYKLFKEQQKVILQQQQRIQELERRAAKAENEISRTRQTVKANADAVTTTRREIEATRKDVLDTRTVAATKEDLDRTKAELGTQPSQSVFRADNGPSRWFAFGEFLYLRPTTDIVAFEFSTGTINTETRTTTGLKHDYEPGFRLGFGHRFAGPWDAAFAYTYLRARSTMNASKPLGVDGNLWSPAVGIGSLGCCGEDISTEATLRYKLNYDVADAELGYNFLVGSSIRVRGIAGLRYVRIDQEIEGTFNTSFANGGEGNSGGQNSGVTKAKFWGIGPRLALKGAWDIGSGFSVNGQFGGTIAVGSSSRRYNYAAYRSNGESNFLNNEGPSSARVVPGVEAAISFAYTHDLGGAAFKAAVGYQFNHWFNLPNLAGGGEGSSYTQRSANLGLDGFFVKAAIVW